MDTEDLLKLLNENKVDYVVIGGAALPVYGYVRNKDLEDIKFLKQIKERQNNTEK